MRRVLFMMLSGAVVLFACANDDTASGGGDLPGDRSGDTASGADDAAATDASNDAADAMADATGITDAADSG